MSDRDRKRQAKKIVDKIKNDSSIIPLATEYHDYIDFRSAKEKFDHDLEIKYYAMYLAMGCGSFFGVWHDGKHIIRDDQEPDIFKEWMLQRETL